MGAQMLNFSFTRLPTLVIAGGYHMQLHAYDQTGGLVVCMEGALTVNHGKSGEVIRMLESCTDSKIDNGQSHHHADGFGQCTYEYVNTGRCNDPAANDIIE